MLQRFSVFTLTLLLTTPSHLATSQALFADSSRLREPFTVPSLSSTFNYAYRLGASELRLLPYRERDEFLRLMPGVADISGRLYVRGARWYELGHYINGVRLTNRYLGTSELHVIPEAIESFSLSTGGSVYFSDGAMTMTQMRTGADDLHFEASIRTDNVTKTGNEFLGTTSFGYRTSVVTAGGTIPVGEGIRFFLAGENHFVRNRQAMYLDAFRYDSLRTDMYDISPGRPLPGSVAFGKNFIPNNWRERNTMQGTLIYNEAPFALSLTGSYQHDATTTGAEWPSALNRIFNQKRTPQTNTASGFFSFAAAYNVFENLRVDASLTYYSRATEQRDPDFGTDWKLYTDSIANAQRGYTEFLWRWQWPNDYSVVNGFFINHQSKPNTAFSKDDQRAWMASGRITFDLDDTWRFDVGGEYERWRMRRFSIANIQQLMMFLYGSTGNTPRPFSDERERTILSAQRGIINHYGYDVDGNLASDGFEPARTPVFAAAYLAARMKQEDVSLDAGIRFELYDTKLKAMLNRQKWDFDNRLGVISESSFGEQSPIWYALPRVNIRYALSSTSTLFINGGMFVNMPPLENLYQSLATMNMALLYAWGSIFSPPVGGYARPERSNCIEVGYSGKLSEFVGLQATGFLRRSYNQLSVQSVPTPGYGHYLAYSNEDESEIKGLSLGLFFRSRVGVSARVHYTLSDAKGTGSHPLSHLGKAGQGVRSELIMSPLDFHQMHTLSSIVSYESGKRDDFLADINAAVVVRYGSGHPYTRVQPPTFGGAANPWNNGVQALLDPRFAFPTEPPNSATTPSTVTCDLYVGKAFEIGSVGIEVYALALNLFNTKNILNVYPTTGSAEDDGWLSSDNGHFFDSNPMYAEFYRTINLRNRWAYMSVTGNDIYGSPRQVRFGLAVRI
ncbi:MAG TPA: TonB-dependent receptor [Bacteroidota bacterium]|nr:TonB-dependent receptor [Bacteroidota bacterium]